MSDSIVEVEIPTPLGKIFEVGMISKKHHMGSGKLGKQSVPVYDKRCINYIAEIIKERPQKKFDCLVLITGVRRSGKSTLAQQIAKAVDKAFSEKKIAFRLEEFNEIIRTNPQAEPKKGIYPQVILDEAGFDLFSQNWMKEVQKNLVKKFEVIGARNQIVYLVLPHRTMLNKSMREGMIHFWINVSLIDQHRGFAELRVGQENIWDLNTYWKPLLAFTFDDSKDDLSVQYNIKKEMFIDEVTADLPDKEDPRARRIYNQRDIVIRIARKHGAMQKEIAEATGLTASAISTIINNDDSNNKPPTPL